MEKDLTPTKEERQRQIRNQISAPQRPASARVVGIKKGFILLKFLANSNSLSEREAKVQLTLKRMINQGKSEVKETAALSLDDIFPEVNETEDSKIEEEAKRKYEEMIRVRRDHLLGLRDKIVQKQTAERQKTLRDYTKEKPKENVPIVVPKLDAGKFSLTQALAAKIKQELVYEEATTPRVRITVVWI
jgi:vacuolar-type H+-ATPase subunit H